MEEITQNFDEVFFKYLKEKQEILKRYESKINNLKKLCDFYENRKNKTQKGEFKRRVVNNDFLSKNLTREKIQKALNF